MVSLDIKMANLETKYCIFRQCLTFSSISKTFFQLLACKYGHLFAQPWHQMYFAPTHHQSCMSVCFRPLPTLQNEPVPQVLKQVVNLCCYLWNTGHIMTNVYLERTFVKMSVFFPPNSFVYFYVSCTTTMNMKDLFGGLFRKLFLFT